MNHHWCRPVLHLQCKYRNLIQFRNWYLESTNQESMKLMQKEVNLTWMVLQKSCHYKCRDQLCTLASRMFKGLKHSIWCTHKVNLRKEAQQWMCPQLQYKHLGMMLPLLVSDLLKLLGSGDQFCISLLKNRTMCQHKNRIFKPKKTMRYHPSQCI